MACGLGSVDLCLSSLSRTIGESGYKYPSSEVAGDTIIRARLIENLKCKDGDVIQVFRAEEMSVVDIKKELLG